MWRIAAILAAIAAFVYVAVVGVQWLQPRVEEDILNRVNTALATQGQLWADVAVDGRKVTLTGEAPDEASRDAAMKLANQVFGVSGVTDETVLAEPADTNVVAATPSAYQLVIEKDNERIVVRGQVASEDDANVIRRLLRNHYDDLAVEDALEVVPSAPAGWRSAVGVVLMNMTNLEKASATLSGTEVMLEGEVLDERYSNDLQTAISATLPRGYKAAYAVDVVSASVVDAAVASETASTDVAPVDAKAEKPAAEMAPKADTKVEPKAENVDAKVAAKVAAVAPAAGCPGVKAIADAKVYFDFDKAALKAEYKPVVKQVAETMKACVDQHVTVVGYTDKTGSALYNQWLSEQRAESGVRALIRQGVARERLDGVGRGEVVTGNETRQGRAQNRRIEFEAKSNGTVATVVSEPADAQAGSATTGWWSSLLKMAGQPSDSAAAAEASAPAAK